MAHPLQYATGRLKEKDPATAELGRQCYGKTTSRNIGLERKKETAKTVKKKQQQKQTGGNKCSTNTVKGS